MSAADPRGVSDLPLHIRNDAAAWIMQLHATRRTPKVNAALRRWLAQSEQHREAFEMASDLWQAGATLPVSMVGRLADRVQREPPLWRPPLAWAATLVCMAVLISWVYQSRHPALTTAVGEQRTLSLADGTRVTLNTATRLMVAYDDRVRLIKLEKGEALFEVAKATQRPFVVAAGDRQITALGTAFMVRRDRDLTAVTLVDGKVSVAPLADNYGGRGDRRVPATLLAPGERMTFHDAQVKLDRPLLERVTAWKRGQASFQDTPLPDAIVEMNRYSEKRLVIGDTAAAATRVSGIFRVGESETFALALENTYPLRSEEQGDEIVIYGMAKDGR